LKIKLIILFIFVCIFSSCTTFRNDWGSYNPENIHDEDLVVLYVWRYITISKIDGEDVNWGKKFDQNSLVKIPPGVHTFIVSYNSHDSYTMFPVIVTAKFEKGNTYIMRYSYTKINNSPAMEFNIYLYNENIIGEKITFNSNDNKLNSFDVTLRYTQYILSPQGDSVGNSIKLENENYILIFNPGLIYKLTDKETNITTEGRAGYEINILSRNSKVYLYEVDLNEMSKEDFLNTDYKDMSQIVLIPIECSATEVKYRYEKPLELSGSEITFSITEMEK